MLDLSSTSFPYASHCKVFFSLIGGMDFSSAALDTGKQGTDKAGNKSSKDQAAKYQEHGLKRQKVILKVGARYKTARE